MDGLNDENSDEDAKVMVLAATNHPGRIDQAFRRRFEKRVFVSLPDFDGRMALLNLYLKNVTTSDDLDLEKIANSLEGYSCADITNVCRYERCFSNDYFNLLILSYINISPNYFFSDAALMSMRRKILGKSPSEIKLIKREEVDLPVTAEDFTEAVEKTRKSVSETDVKNFEVWMKEYGSC